MAYEKQALVDEQTVVTAAILGHIEDGVLEVDNTSTATAARVATLEGEVTANTQATSSTSQTVTGLSARVTAAQTTLDALSSPAETSLSSALASGIVAAPHGGSPVMNTAGSRREIHGRVALSSGANFAAGSSVVIGTLQSASDYPSATFSMGTTCTGAGFVRIEVSAASGSITCWPSVATAWIGLDGVWWYTK